jgi:hypothetical protein
MLVDFAISVKAGFCLPAPIRQAFQTDTSATKIHHGVTEDTEKSGIGRQDLQEVKEVHELNPVHPVNPV